MDSLYLPDLKAFLRYHDLPGRGPARVYLHGLGSASSTDFPATAAYPAHAGHRSLLVDLLGFGYSDRPRRFGYTLEDHAQTVARLLDGLGLAGCAVLGHSMGGSVAIVLAFLRPDLVSRLVVAEGNLDPGGGTVSTPIARQGGWLFGAVGYRLGLRSLAGKARGNPSYASYASSWRACSPDALHRSAVGLVKGTVPTMRQMLLSLSIPRTYIFGQHSLPDPDRELLAGQGVKVLVVPGAGHAMMSDNPAGFAETLAAAFGG